VYTAGVLGDVATRNDDVLVDGRIITAEDFNSAPLFGRTIAEFVLRGTEASTFGVRALDNVAVENSDNDATLEIFRSGAMDHAQVVRFRATGSAITGEDYATVGDHVLFQPRQTSAMLNIVPVDDGIAEEDEELFFELLADPSYGLDPLRSAVVAILD
jgi:hypothetical protein